ncbi:MAG: hypothetical protein A3F40_02225 [Chlamydiae bacterium RIFCSPHIGHO2_12_FULL_27_8]|nr:MAG: hypothetical protein A3F40_02225 [Chlamydiae bacterium RIFCSPHIGHO2_12_FULL_27_8]
MDQNKFYMLQALKQAEIAFSEDEVPIGAVIVYNNRIIVKAHNQVETLKDATAHAEMLVITQAEAFLNDWRLNECTLYVTLEPCIMCFGAILLSRLKKVVYAAKDNKIGSHDYFINYCENKNISNNIEIEGGVLEELSTDLLKKFFINKRKEKV